MDENLLHIQRKMFCLISFDNHYGFIHERIKTLTWNADQSNIRIYIQSKEEKKRNARLLKMHNMNFIEVYMVIDSFSYSFDEKFENTTVRSTTCNTHTHWSSDKSRID